ncbi:MAG TPA: hypothetical protein VH092_28045, partial [Urbifossiella sp.]|nr:hypothetical protein [Urbifossiella sp.]
DTNALVDRAWRDRLGEVAGRFGIDPHGRYSLPEAVEVGSREDARALTSWMTQGQGQMTAENLLQQILLVLQQQLNQGGNLARNIGREIPIPPVINLPW